MREAIFYQLIKNHQKTPYEYIPVSQFQGDVWCKELNLGGFVSHECSARLSEINSDNPHLLEIEKRKAKYTPAKYHCYRLRPDFDPSYIKDKGLRSFFERLNITISPVANKPKYTYKYDKERNCMVQYQNY